MAAEFDLINHYFRFSDATKFSKQLGVETGVGDDAAVLKVNRGRLIVATDTLVEGVHFPIAMAAGHVASRAVGVNLSDFAAMGVKPQWLTLSLCMPSYDESWIAAFAGELQQCCERYSLALVGGDTVRAGLSIGFTVMGLSEGGSAGDCLLRSGAQVGDDLWVSGSLGAAAAALTLLENNVNSKWSLSGHERETLLAAFYCPQPRLELGLSLQKIASAAIDISDGLLADALHLATQSGVGLSVRTSNLPIAEPLLRYPEPQQANDWALRGGDDYELLFTARSDQRDTIQALEQRLDLKLSRIGCVVDGDGLKLDGQSINTKQAAGYSHF
jgi:thiamine-monophosphate kinase